MVRPDHTIARWLTALAAASVRRARLTVAMTVVLAAGLAAIAANYLTVNTDTNALFDSTAPFRVAEDRFTALFPDENDQILIVIDAPSALASTQAAERLIAALKLHPDVFVSVRQPSGGRFFLRNGLLYLSTAELSALADKLTLAQPMIGTLAADPSLRGLSDVLSLASRGASRDQFDGASILPLVRQLQARLEADLAGHHAAIDWAKLFATGGEEASGRTFVLARPKRDMSALASAATATDLARSAARGLGITPENGFRVRLTGSIPLDDEEFATVASGAKTAGIASVVLVTVLLMLALGSVRLVAAALSSLALGFAMTLGWATVAVGRLNLISIAFAVMFVGLAIDFGIQFVMRLREERYRQSSPAAALDRTIATIVRPLMLAAAATAIGFFSFVPTAYRGVAELGIIAGGGIVIAFLLTITYLPALLSLMPPATEVRPVGAVRARGLNAWLVRRRWLVMGAMAAITLAALVGLKSLTFDFDPLHLKDPNSESMATLMDLINDPWATPYTLNVIVPSADAARAVEQKLAVLPQVRQTVSLDDFVPQDQEAKLGIIQDLSFLMGLAVAPGAVKPAPDAAALTTSLNDLAAAGRHYVSSDKASEPLNGATTALLGALDKLAAVKDPARLQQIAGDVMTGLPDELSTLALALDPQPVSARTLPADLRPSWVAANGDYRVMVYPKGDTHNPAVLRTFVKAVRSVAPDAVGPPISIFESGNLVIGAFVMAAILAVAATSVLLLLALRRVEDVLRVLLPLVLAVIWTLGLAGATGLAINFANIIGLPLLLGIGVTFPIYLVHAWRLGEASILTAPVARAVLYSALTTLASFGSLALSRHPGTADLGLLLTIAISLTLALTLIGLPALLGPPPERS